MNNAVATSAQNINIHLNKTQWLQPLPRVYLTTARKAPAGGHHRLPRGNTTGENAVFLLTPRSLLLFCYFFAEKSSARLNASPKESFWRDLSRAGKKPPGNNYRNSPVRHD